MRPTLWERRVFNIYQTHITTYPEAPLKSSQTRVATTAKGPLPKAALSRLAGGAGAVQGDTLAPASLVQMRGCLGDTGT